MQPAGLRESTILTDAIVIGSAHTMLALDSFLLLLLVVNGQPANRVTFWSASTCFLTGAGTRVAC